jgi:hypothetical protein
MKLQRREKILAAAAGAAVALLGVHFLWVSGPSLGSLRSEHKRLASEADKRQDRIQAAAGASAQLTQWERSALPAESSNARSLYQSWLRALAHQAGLRQLDVQSGEGQSHKGVYTLFSFTVRGRSTLAELVQFLYGFYSAGHLHKLRVLDLKPLEGARTFDVTMTIEALSLPGADRKDQLSQVSSARLRFAKPSDYADVIAARNLFAPYAPPSRRRQQVDPSQYTFITAIITGDSSPAQVWLEERLTGKKWKLAEGEAFEVAGTRGTVKTINPRDAVIEWDGHTQRFRYGDNLQGGTEVP